MKLLIMSDIHARWSMFQPALMPPPEGVDAVIVAGDITNLGKPKGWRMGVSEDWEAAQRWEDWEAAQRWMEKLYQRYEQPGRCRVYWIPGNHDINVKGGDFFGSCALSVHDQCTVTHTLPQLPLAVIAGSALCTAFDMPRLAETLAHTTAHRGEDLQHWQQVPAADIVVSHCPPLGVLDSAGRALEKRYARDGSVSLTYGDERHIGSPGLLEYIHRHKPRLVVCGHVHNESKGGPAGDGRMMVGETLVVNTAERWQVVEV